MSNFLEKFLPPGPPVKEKNPPKKKKSRFVPDTDCGVTEDDAAAVDKSIRFSPDAFRLSLITREEVNEYSFDGIHQEGESDDDKKSSEGLVLTDEEEEENRNKSKERWNQKYTPRTPRVVRLGNIATAKIDDTSSEDDEDLYLSDSDTEEETPKVEEGDEDEDEEEDGSDAFMALPTFRAAFSGSDFSNSSTPSVGNNFTESMNMRGLTQSIVDFTTDLQMTASLNQIDQMLYESSQNARNRRVERGAMKFSNEDGDAVLAQMNIALGIKATDASDDILIRKLDAVPANNNIPDLECNIQAHKITDIAEKGEQVHRNRRFASQSITIRNPAFQLSSENESSQGADNASSQRSLTRKQLNECKVSVIQTPLKPFKEFYDESEEESEEDSNATETLKEEGEEEADDGKEDISQYYNVVPAPEGNVKDEHELIAQIDAILSQQIDVGCQ